MNKQTEALEMAIEALERVISTKVNDNGDEVVIGIHGDIITALDCQIALDKCKEALNG